MPVLILTPSSLVSRSLTMRHVLRKQFIPALRQRAIGLIMLVTGFGLPYSLGSGTPRAMLEAGVPIMTLVAIFALCGAALVLLTPRALPFALLLSPLLIYAIIALILLANGANFPAVAIGLYGGIWLLGLIEAYDRWLDDDA